MDTPIQPPGLPYLQRDKNGAIWHCDAVLGIVERGLKVSDAGLFPYYHTVRVRDHIDGPDLAVLMVEVEDAEQNTLWVTTAIPENVRHGNMVVVDADAYIFGRYADRDARRIKLEQRFDVSLSRRMIAPVDQQLYFAKLSAAMAGSLAI